AMALTAVFASMVGAPMGIMSVDWIIPIIGLGFIFSGGSVAYGRSHAGSMGGTGHGGIGGFLDQHGGNIRKKAKHEMRANKKLKADKRMKALGKEHESLIGTELNVAAIELGCKKLGENISQESELITDSQDIARMENELKQTITYIKQQLEVTMSKENAEEAAHQILGALVEALEKAREGIYAKDKEIIQHHEQLKDPTTKILGMMKVASENIEKLGKGAEHADKGLSALEDIQLLKLEGEIKKREHELAKGGEGEEVRRLEREIHEIEGFRRYITSTLNTLRASHEGLIRDMPPVRDALVFCHNRMNFLNVRLAQGKVTNEALKKRGSLPTQDYKGYSKFLEKSTEELYDAIIVNAQLGLDFETEKQGVVEKGRSNIQVMFRLIRSLDYMRKALDQIVKALEESDKAVSVGQGGMRDTLEKALKNEEQLANDLERKDARTGNIIYKGILAADQELMNAFPLIQRNAEIFSNQVTSFTASKNITIHAIREIIPVLQKKTAAAEKGEEKATLSFEKAKEKAAKATLNEEKAKAEADQQMAA
ncbi:MAG: hypothetical protein QF915_05600, partial [Candidatus Woesearchaeota archaeon]|nr:hypothetical protein [Candidatus Woesearchaeota archaeon]